MGGGGVEQSRSRAWQLIIYLPFYCRVVSGGYKWSRGTEIVGTSLCHRVHRQQWRHCPHQLWGWDWRQTWITDMSTSRKGMNYFPFPRNVLPFFLFEELLSRRLVWMMKHWVWWLPVWCGDSHYVAVHFIARIVHLLPPRHICQTLDVNEGLIQRKSGCRRAIIEAGASRVYIQMMVSLFIMVFLFRRLSFFQSWSDSRDSVVR